MFKKAEIEETDAGEWAIYYYDHRNNSAPKYKQYSTLGQYGTGSNYREVTFALPIEENKFQSTVCIQPSLIVRKILSIFPLALPA